MGGIILGLIIIAAVMAAPTPDTSNAGWAGH